MNREEVLKLAKLARIEIGDTEAEKLSHEFDSILKYVSEVKKVTSKNIPGGIIGDVNSMREDANPHEPGIFTEKILAEAPERKDNYLKVKKIL